MAASAGTCARSSGCAILAWASARATAALARSDRAYEEMFRTLGRFSRPGYVPELMRAVGPELTRSSYKKFCICIY